MIKTQRVFIALWPPDPVRAALARVAAELSGKSSVGRVVPEANLHLTLAFIGALEEERVAQLAPVVALSGDGPFSWRLDHVGAFERARVLWAGGQHNASLAALAQTMRGLLDRLQINYDRKPFAPHVTLVRDAKKLPRGSGPITPPIDWPCERPVLVRSVSQIGGVRYMPISAA